MQAQAHKATSHTQTLRTCNTATSYMQIRAHKSLSEACSTATSYMQIRVQAIMQAYTRFRANSFMPSSNTMWSQPINKIHQAVSVAFLARRMALRRRQSCDRLSPHDEAGLAKALEDYIHQKHAASETLWDFGEYGANPKLLEKKTPAIETLLKNHDLWTMILGFMPQAKVRDTYVIAAIGKAMNKFSFVNTTSYPDDLFRSWLAGCIHVQVSHLRNLKRYRARYQYRMAKMSSQDQAAIDLLLDGIVAEVHEGEIAKPFEGTAAEATHLLSRVPEMFLQEATQGEVQHAPTNAFWDQVPSMFKDADSLPCAAKCSWSHPPHLQGRIGLRCAQAFDGYNAGIPGTCSQREHSQHLQGSHRCCQEQAELGRGDVQARCMPQRHHQGNRRCHQQRRGHDTGSCTDHAA